jgi:hypothetical protein
MSIEVRSVCTLQLYVHDPDGYGLCFHCPAA